MGSEMCIRDRVLVVVLLSAVVIFILDAVFGFGLSTVLDLLAKV